VTERKFIGQVFQATAASHQTVQNNRVKTEIFVRVFRIFFWFSALLNVVN